MNLKPVYSSHISHIGYEDGVLRVRFSKGQIVDYLDVSPEIADSILKAPSIGEALHAHVRRRFTYRYVNPNE